MKAEERLARLLGVSGGYTIEGFGFASHHPGQVAELARDAIAVLRNLFDEASKFTDAVDGSDCAWVHDSGSLGEALDETRFWLDGGGGA